MADGEPDVADPGLPNRSRLANKRRRGPSERFIISLNFGDPAARSRSGTWIADNTQESIGPRSDALKRIKAALVAGLASATALLTAATSIAAPVGVFTTINGVARSRFAGDTFTGGGSQMRGKVTNKGRYLLPAVLSRERVRAGSDRRAHDERLFRHGASTARTAA